MLGFMVTANEIKELDYMLKKEMDEILLDLSDSRLDKNIKVAILKRYKTIYSIFSRYGDKKEKSKYIESYNKYRVQYT